MSREETVEAMKGEGFVIDERYSDEAASLKTSTWAGFETPLRRVAKSGHFRSFALVPPTSGYAALLRHTHRRPRARDATLG